MKNIVDTFGLTQYVTDPTRNGAVLDLLFCNSPDFIRNVNVIPGISDHLAVVAVIHKEKNRAKLSTTRRVYFYEKGDYDAISEKLRNFFSVFECLSEERNVHDMWDNFKDMLLELVSVHIPNVDSSRLKKRKQPWVTTHILKLIKKRMRAFNAFKKSKSAAHFTKLHTITREYKLKIGKAKDDYFNELSNKMKSNPKMFWKHLKQCGSDSFGIQELNYNGRIIMEDEDKAACLNNFFHSVFLPNHTCHIHQPTTNISPMLPVELSINGIEKLLKDIDESKSSGPDGISPRVLKRCAGPISMYLYLIFEKSLSTGILPHDWKIAHVVPIHKGGSKKDVGNYRPISLTSIPCKILEHILYKQILNHLNKHKVLINEQHGFRRGLSCTTQLVEFYHDIISSVDAGGQVDGVFLDFRKAFDTVSHSLLLFKLNTLHIDATVFKWIECYLSQRRQCVILNGKCSEYANVTSGVPQGSVLGPLLFLVYINDISAGISSSIRLFADDCVVYKKISHHNDTIELQNDLTIIHDWCTKWKMTLNITKCVHLSFTKKKKPIQSQYHLNNVLLKQGSTYKYLGVLLSSECSWKPQVESIIAKAGKALNFIQRNLRCSHANLKRMAYTTCVRPLLEYGCVVWDPTR